MSAISNFIKINNLIQIMYFTPNLENRMLNLQNLSDASSNTAVLWQILDFSTILDVLRQNLQNLKIKLQQTQYVKSKSRFCPDSEAQTNLEFCLMKKSIIINMLVRFADFVPNLWQNLRFYIINQYIRLNSRYDITHPIPIGIESPYKQGSYSTPGIRGCSKRAYLPTILSLDLGTLTGWAAHSNSGHIISGTISFKPNRFEGGGMRYLRFTQWLNEVHSSLGHIDAVYFEEVRRHLGVDAAHAYGGFLAHLTAWCEDKSIPYQGVPVGTIKRFIAGKGNAGKGEVTTAVIALGHKPKDDNEADALALLHYALKQHNQRR